jgi:NitT/TauT family transport system ATP-binding protein
MNLAALSAPISKQSDQQDLLTLRSVTKSYISSRKVVHALFEVDLAVKQGEFVCIVGPSGCGKTTLLNMVAGLEFPDSGFILKGSEIIKEPGRDRLVMFQDAALFPWRTVLGNVLFGLELIPGLARSERKDRAQAYLEMVGLKDFAKAYVHELSGGMKQRVALARALAPMPEVLLMDEPFAALDAMTRERLYSDLQRICAEEKKTVILVTHNIREAVCLGDRVILFSPTPGRISAEFDIKLTRPRDINSVDLARYSTEIMRSLRQVVSIDEPIL